MKPVLPVLCWKSRNLPGDLVLDQLQHAGDVVLVDMRDVDEVELAAVARDLAEGGGDSCEYEERMPVDQHAGVVGGGEQQAVTLVGLEDLDPS